MLAKFNEPRNIFIPYCTPNAGYFGLEADYNRVNHWDTCREQFAAKFNENIEGFYFSHKENKGYDIANFLCRFEIVIKSSHDQYNFDFSEYCLTSSPCVLYVKLSKFWRECFYKRNLFTMLLRCAQNFDSTQNNFDEVLFDEKYKETLYVNETKMAVIRFMFGFTKYTGVPPIIGGTTVVKHGWKEEFHKLEIHDLRMKLVLPDGFKKFTNIVGMDSLWC